MFFNIPKPNSQKKTTDSNLNQVSNFQSYKTNSNQFSNLFSRLETTGSCNCGK